MNKDNSTYDKHPRVRGHHRNQELEEKQELARAEMKAMVEQLKEGETKEAKEIRKKLYAPSLLNDILKEFDKTHIGDEKQKMFVFLDCLSSRLKPSYRFSCALTADSAEGKTNLWNTIKKHLPNNWYLDLTRVTGAALENLVKEYNLIYFGEGGANDSIIEQIKQFTEDGMSVLKYDTEKDNKEARHDKQPRKVGLYSTTGNIDDEELSSRYCVVSVHGDKNKYQQVNQDTLLTAANPSKEIEKDTLDKEASWLKKGLQLLEPYDIINIPYASLFEVNCENSRSQRDLKRFLNLIRAITWLHQYQRIRFEYKGYNILLSSPEDVYNALSIGKQIFDQSLSGLEPRLQETIDAYLDLKEKKIIPGEIIDNSAPDLDWVERNELQRSLNVSRDTIKERTERLSDFNILRIFVKSNRVYIALAKKNTTHELPTNNPLITHDKKQLYDVIKTNYPRILKNGFVGKSGVPLSLDYIESGLFSPVGAYHPRKHPRTPETPLFDELKQLLDAKKSKIRGCDSWVDNSTAKKDEKQHSDNKIDFEENKGFTKKIYDVMLKHPARDWYFTEIQRFLNPTSDLSTAKELKEYLDNLIMRPDNDSGIGKSRDEGYYHLTKIQKR